MRVYRVAYRAYAEAPLNGEGSFLFGGRWSSEGTRMAYTSSTLTLAMLEFLAHVEVEDFDPANAPELVFARIELPDDAAMELAEIGATLPENWTDVPAPDEVRGMGDAWIRSARSLALVVPSVLVPLEASEPNVLINPAHPRFSEVHYDLAELTYDRRLLAVRRGRAKPDS